MASDLTQVPYIGEKSVRELKRGLSRRKRMNLTPRQAANLGVDYLQVALDKRQRKELAKFVGDKPVSLMTRQERQEATARQQSGPTETSETIRRGDFSVPRDSYEKALDQHESRSEKAQEYDEDRRARVTTDFARWSSDPNSYDYPGVDTPSRRRPRREEKDKGLVGADNLLRPFESDQDDGDDDDDPIIPGL